tara:strand:- start:8943 stop:9422 length:480 start_codon:yes stop_codon:yes gene_type:complete
MKKTILKKVLLLFITSSILLSCSDSIKYKNFKGFKEYLKEIHIESKVDNQIFYIVRIEDCFTCSTTETNLNMLSKLDTIKNLKIITVGNTTRDIYKKLIKTIANKNKVFEDKSSKIFSFETGFSKPLLIHLKNKKKVLFFREITDDKINLAEAYISNYK